MDVLEMPGNRHLFFKLPLEKRLKRAMMVYERL
jgi:hypothetical protein